MTKQPETESKVKKATRNLLISIVAAIIAELGLFAAALMLENTLWLFAPLLGAFLGFGPAIYLILLFGTRADEALLSSILPDKVCRALRKLHLPTD